MASLTADTIIQNGHVITLDAHSSELESIAIKGTHIIAVGTNADVADFVSGNSQIIDVEGRSIIPGIIDAHAHMEREGLKSVRPSLAGIRSIADIQGRIGKLVQNQKRGKWVITMPIGDPPHYYDELDNIAENRMPNRWELDAVAPDNPVCIMAAFGNWGSPPCYWALNSLALALNGIDKDTRSAFPEVIIEKDLSTGEPTGVIVEYSQRPIAPFNILKALPPFTYEERIKGLRKSMRLYNSVGTTSIYEGHGSSPESIALYRDLHERKELTVRSSLNISPTWRNMTQAREQLCSGLSGARGQSRGDDWLSINGIFIGLLGDKKLREHALNALPDTGWSGFIEPSTNYDDFAELANLCAINDFRLHTIVSGRMDKVISILEHVNRINHIDKRRWVIEHIDIVEPKYIAKLKMLGVCVTAIPVSTIWQRGINTIGRSDDGNNVMPLRSLVEANVPIAAGTDNIPYNPFYTLWAMMARKERVKGEIIGADQRLTAEQGLRALTIEGARLSFEEGNKGSIEVGKLGDIAVLSDNPMSANLETIKQIRSDLTIVGGEIVHNLL